jgi:hypothetical protein
MNSRSSLASRLAPSVISAADVPAATGAAVADVPTLVEEVADCDDVDKDTATAVADPAVAGIKTDDVSPTAVGVVVVVDIAKVAVESPVADDSLV